MLSNRTKLDFNGEENMIERDPKYYTTGHTGDDPYKAPFYLRSLVFDNEGGDLNTHLVDEFNSFLQEEGRFRKQRLVLDEKVTEKFPEKILVINASHDNLPTSYETARIFEDYCKSKGYSVPAKVINRKEELDREIAANPGKCF